LLYFVNVIYTVHKITNLKIRFVLLLGAISPDSLGQIEISLIFINMWI